MENFGIGIEGNYSEKSSEKLYRNEVSPCVDPVVQASVEEAKERLKKIQQEYERACKMYRQVQSNMYRLYREGKGTGHYSHYASNCIYHCKSLVKQLQNVLDSLNTEEATQPKTKTPNHSKKFLLLHGWTNLAQEKKILQQKAEHKQQNNDKLSQKPIDFKAINWGFRYIQEEIPRSSRKKHIHDLLSKLKETNKLREKATLGGAMLLMKIIQEFEKEKGETDKVLGEKRMIEKGYRETMRHLQEKKEHLCKKWDDERKYLLGLKNTPQELLYFLPAYKRWMLS